MIAGVLILNAKGDVIASRFFRPNVSKHSSQHFRSKIIGAKNTGKLGATPVMPIEGSSFLYIRRANLFFVAVTTLNPNAALVFEFLFQLHRIFKSYFEGDVDEDSIRDHITLVYELLDEVLDFGYPQNCSVDVLQLYINLGNVKKAIDAAESSQLTSQITGAIDWRREGIRYRKNEVYIDLLESVNLLMNQDGTPLSVEVSGQVMMKAFLTGMPECKFGLNDKLIMDKDSANQHQHGKRHQGVEIDDCTFHRCVRLGKFDADRTITFIPPDGEFELMRYRVTDNVRLPFRVIPTIHESRSKVSINLKLASRFSTKLYGSNVVIKIPVPPNTAKCKIQTPVGRARHEPEQGCIVWRIKRFAGENESYLRANIDLVQGRREKQWSRPPLVISFVIPMFASSGVHVRFLKIYDKSGYHTNRWVRYITRSGDYHIRI